MARKARNYEAERARRALRAERLYPDSPEQQRAFRRGHPEDAPGTIPAKLIRDIENASHVWFPLPVQQPDGTFEQPIVWKDKAGKAHRDYLPLGADASDLNRILEADRSGSGGLLKPLPNIPEPLETP